MRALRSMQPKPKTSDGGTITSAHWMAFEAARFVNTLHGHSEGVVRFVDLKTNEHTRERYVPVADAGRKARECAGRSDMYVSLALYRRPRGPFAGIRTLHVDLDFYKVARWERAGARDVLAAALNVLDRAGSCP